MARPCAFILTYHAIAQGQGPTLTAPATFAAQMQALADSAVKVVSLSEFAAWRRSPSPKPNVALITFDDGFVDFVDVALPILAKHGWPSVLFVPTAKLGGVEDWDDVDGPRRRLMTWAQVRDCTSQGVAIGAHGRTHRNLRQTPVEARDDEIVGCGRDIAAALGAVPSAFAPPFGDVDADVHRRIAEAYELSFGVRFGIADDQDPRFDLPRLDMHYFRAPQRFADLLAGRRSYLRLRQGLRAVRHALSFAGQHRSGAAR